MKEQLEQAKDLLQGMIEAKDVPTIEVIHRLRDLAKVLDHPNFQEECLVVGDCAIKLARAFGSRAVEFQREEAQTILLIAGLNVFKSRACPLFLQAISLYDAFLIMDGSDLTKVTLLHALNGAAAHDETHPALCAQWLRRAVDLISELPSSMVTDKLRGVVYTNYGAALGDLKVDSKALAAKERAVEFYRSLGAGHDQRMYNSDFALALYNYGITLHDMGCLEHALGVHQEAVSLYRSQAADGQEKHKMDLVDALHAYGNMLHRMGRLNDALNVRQETICLHRTLDVDGHNGHKRKLADALHNYGISLHDLGHFEDALSAKQEAVSLNRTLTVDGDEGDKRKLANALYNHGITLYHMGHLKDAFSVEQEAVSLFRALAVDGYEEHIRHLAGALYNHGLTLRRMGNAKDALRVRREAVSLFRTLAVDKERLADALHSYGVLLHDVGHFEDALSARQEAVSLYRVLAVDGDEAQKKKLSKALHNLGITFYHMGHFKDALSVEQETVSLSHTLADEGHKNDPLPPAPSFLSVEVSVPQKKHSTPLSPSITTISITPLSSPTANHLSPLPIVSPSPSICNEAPVELDLHYSSHPSSSFVITNQSPTPAAVIEGGLVSDHVSDRSSGPGRKRKRENGSTWIKNKLRIKKSDDVLR